MPEETKATLPELVTVQIELFVETNVIGSPLLAEAII